MTRQASARLRRHTHVSFIARALDSGILEPADPEREVCVIAGILYSHRTPAFFITLPLLEPRNQIRDW
ncbi:uncharacterized protein N7469_007256 [Penicillium citrinum]|uniref:Uncharacterized protein n=1 Tax=Penicillium citrinum TaxID=5077 RepID=A0A9W9NW28_PENCI|nr:uncharacterized protein N7469_007256 [Penicillium citrinum]KAJ5227250.1 hypothetical protein N7469_007256 [Penicillium citrinum]KAK5791492.1 hypothetical protein VI817_006801 [Penicillium citrinum]